MTAEGRRFVKKGNVIVMKEEVKDREFSAKEIVDNVVSMETMIQNAHDEVSKKEQEIIKFKAEAERLGGLLKEVKKHEEWAVGLQQSKLKALVAELWPALKLEVENEYVVDNVLTQVGNNKQRYAQLQNKLGRHPKIAEAISAKFIKEDIYGPTLVTNPWNVEEA